MANCFYCGKELTGYPFVCRLCDESHCGKHRLPESHECINIGVYKSSSYRNTQLSKNREMKMIKKSGSYSPQSNSRQKSSSRSFGSSGDTLTFNSSLLGEQTIHFLNPIIFSAFLGGFIFGLVQIIGLVRLNLRNDIPIDYSIYLGVAVAAGLGFVLLFLFRQFIGNRYGITTSFGLWPLGIAITFLTALFRFTFYLFGFFHDRGGSARSRAIMGISGTLASFGLWAISHYVIPQIILNTAFGVEYFSILIVVGYAFQNFLWWGIINLIPFGLLDGKKVYDYNSAYYVGLIVLAFVCFFIHDSSSFFYSVFILLL